MADAGAALAARSERNEVAQHGGIITDIKRMQKEFQVAMPRGAEAERLIRDAITAVRQTRHLDKCDSPSVLGALMTCAQLDLRPGVLGQAWVLPFYNSKAKRYSAQLIIGYRGYSELAHRSDKVRSYIPRVVYENDLFDVDYGIAGTLTHKPATGPRGDAAGYHSIARYSNGGYDFLYMTREEMAEHRDKFATTRNRDGQIFGPWIDHPDAMGMKTTQRLLAKFIPQSPRLEVATFVDGGLRIDLNPDSRPEDVTDQPGMPGDAALEGEVLDPDEVRMITPKQRTAIQTISGTRLHQDREEKIAYIRQLIERPAGRPINSTNDLTFEEANTVIDTMTRFAEQQGA